jgi:predicted phosphodiesterase
MRSIAVISDIHSNILALDLILEDQRKRNVDLIVNLGDCLYGPIDPVQTAIRLMEQDNMIHIMGNCDEILLEKETGGLTYQFVKPLLNEEIHRWIQTFHRTWIL